MGRWKAMEGLSSRRQEWRLTCVDLNVGIERSPCPAPGRTLATAIWGREGTTGAGVGFQTWSEQDRHKTLNRGKKRKGQTETSVLGDVAGSGSSLIVGWSTEEVGSYFKASSLVMGKQLFFCSLICVGTGTSTLRCLKDRVCVSWGLTRDAGW